MSIKEDIGSVIEPYKNKPLVQGRKVSVPFMKNTMFDLDFYVYLMHQVLSNNIEFIVPYTDAIYKLAGITLNNCSGGIVSVTNYYMEGKNMVRGAGDNYLYIKSINKYIDISNPDISPGTDIYNHFVQKIIDQYNNEGCEFISILLILNDSKNSGHANMFLVIKDRPRNAVKLIVYEPHGSWGTGGSTFSAMFTESYKNYKKMKDSFIKLMTNIFSVIGVNSSVVNTGVISCSTGIQTRMRDRAGFCVIVSIFWFYIFLRLITSYSGYSDKKTHLLSNLVLIEQYVYSLTTPEQLYSIVINFAYDLISTYYIDYLVPISRDIDSTPREVDKKTYDYLSKYAPTTIYERDGRYYTTASKYDSKYITFKRRFIILYNATNDNKIPRYDNTSKRRVRKTPIPLIDSDTANRKKAGVCSSNSDCISDECVGGLCKPPIDYNRPQFRESVDPRSILRRYRSDKDSSAEESSSEDSSAEESSSEESGSREKRKRHKSD